MQRTTMTHLKLDIFTKCKLMADEKFHFPLRQQSEDPRSHSRELKVLVIFSYQTKRKIFQIFRSFKISYGINRSFKPLNVWHGALDP